jgi:N-acetylmuramoyl-L-alanine amidase
LTKIFIDAGHGDFDPGAIGNNIQEKDIALSLALKIERKLKDFENVETMLSRDTDTFLKLAERTDKANDWGADCFVSLHCNSADSANPKGFETFIYNGSVGSDTIAFQNVMHQEILKQIGNQVQDRGKKRANFHVLRESKMNAILGENLFVSNASDAALLKQEPFLERIVQGYVNGLQAFYGLERTIRPPTDNPDDELYQVIAGTYSNYQNALIQAEKLRKDGYAVYIKKA